MAATDAAALNIALLLLTFSVKNSDQKCFVAKNQHKNYCDSLDDLYNNNDLLKDVTITERDNTPNLEEFKAVPLEVAQNIERLQLRSVINKVNEDAFVNFTSIQFLTLFKNKLDEIPVGIFRNLNVRILDFYQNGIGRLSPGAFVNLTKMEEIRFPFNNLTKITFNIFNNLTTKGLVLSNNQISKIEKFSFGNMPNLKKLFLDNNLLTEFIAQENLHHPEVLEKLWLHSNRLTEVTVYMLEGLTNLKVLNLGFNSISSIEPKAFAETPKLQILVLTHNSLKVISGNILPTTGLDELQILYLDHNRLTYLSSNFFFRLNALRLASIGGNPWQCPCLDLVLRWLYDNGVKLNCDKAYLNGERPVCVVPDVNNVCVYSYDENHYQRFQSQISLYPPPPWCIL
ncbi:LRR 8 domain containing protein [Asbolus verrucosus]|uniref:LRR 8 domain containing protein n=1 Tax=Asbolus verrucosus TaxID=1661398 RepID=A0A482WDH2_ASBVE|nr:LRR 8 domain containing protein [Asbolus verrucosus]